MVPIFLHLKTSGTLISSIVNSIGAVNWMQLTLVVNFVANYARV